MDQEPPVKRNLFLIVVVVLFNLIWLTLLFMSCRAEKVPLGESSRPNEVLVASWDWGAISEWQTQSLPWGAADSAAEACPADHNVPLYKPPSTWSITPLT